MSWPNTNEVLEALEVQAVCYRTLAGLATDQHRHVRSGGAEGERALLDVLEQRQTVMDQVAALEPTLGPVRQDWPAFAETLEAEQRTRAEALLGEARDLLSKITQGDQEDTLVLQQRKLTAGNALRTNKTKTAAGRHYAGNAYAKQKSVDFKG